VLLRAQSGTFCGCQVYTVVYCRFARFNCSPFYRQKSESPNQPTGESLQSTEASEKCSHASVDGLRLSQVDKCHGWLDVSHSSSVTADSVTEVIPTVDGSVYGLSLTQRHLTSDSSSWASLATAALVPSSGMFIFGYDSH